MRILKPGDKDGWRTRSWSKVRTGGLEKGPCKVCGSSQVQMHHLSYNDRFEVEWLCAQHHGVAHTGPGRKQQKWRIKNGVVVKVIKDVKY